MSRSLYLLRHAKSDWKAPFGHDRERTLNARGIRAAAQMGRWLTEQDEAPELILVSSAVRTRETIRLAAEAGGWEAPVEVVDEFYESIPETILARVADVPASIERVLVCGHEPTMSEVIRKATGQFVPHFPTACLARVDGDQLLWLVPPKSLDS